MSGKPYQTGVIHGRFQVLHLDHRRYLLAGAALCRHLVVGITNPEPELTRKDPADPERSLPQANPLTYFERYQLVRATLSEAGLSEGYFSIVPLPINLPERYRHYVPLDAVFLLSIFDDWGRRKQAMFQELGLRTHLLWEVPTEEKGLSAGNIRHLMATNQPWQHLVPPAVARLLTTWQIPQRLATLAAAAQPDPEAN
ncbi:nicotinamide mononucleotide adenylyltransferase [Desulfurivibrio alkaliphilus]|uniref:Nicotinamide mononucleotide adenylyltransferase-like protein n=1 Tax=Desulfurivibrio alkaliphilus (strain DSM 19089 / UNIQEM U267 / AHT2) TaxID=589865 RepID=D6Z1I2_DESAT|nr:nicotinamide mononucleotide adenylyltransferase [Desulfurivibrio alkaliphilus]ADH87316.1 nicotinamide mononucleotide adenylyltransferase-like protein [Desulfurivibrio alkaliphilus AHT 2]